MAESPPRLVLFTIDDTVAQSTGIDETLFAASARHDIASAGWSFTGVPPVSGKNPLRLTDMIRIGPERAKPTESARHACLGDSVRGKMICARLKYRFVITTFDTLKNTTGLKGEEHARCRVPDPTRILFPHRDVKSGNYRPIEQHHYR